jgi:hypothetical protein
VGSGGTGQTTYTNGQLLIGNTTGNTLTKTTLTQGSGITITNGAGSITIANSAPHQATNIGYTASTRILTSSTGTGFTFPEVVAAGNSGLMTGSDKTKLDGLSNYSLPLAANGTRGGVQIGYVENGQNYPVQLSSEKMFVNVP